MKPHCEQRHGDRLGVARRDEDGRAAGCSHGDAAAALRDFLVGHYDELMRRLTRYVGCPDLAADSLHDTWLRLEDKGCSAEVLNPSAFVFRMACNVANDRARAEKRRSGPCDFDLVLDELADEAPGPPEIAEARSEVRRLIHAVEQLPRRRQAIFIGVRIKDLSQREVAARFGVSLRVVARELRDTNYLSPLALADSL